MPSSRRCKRTTSSRATNSAAAQRTATSPKNSTPTRRPSSSKETSDRCTPASPARKRVSIFPSPWACSPLPAKRHLGQRRHPRRRLQPAGQNSAALGLSNFDITFFAAFDDVDNPGILGLNGVNNNLANLYGVTAFIDAFDGYIETGYGVIDGQGAQDGTTHFLTAAYSRRYYNTVSNSTRVFANFGDDPDGDSDGVAIISENSLITSLPSTLLPYANFFVGFGNPQPLVDGFNAGILKNVGINFETDALTGYPRLDDTGSNALGGAVGLQYLFNLDQQVVFELAMVQPFEDDGVGAKDAQYAIGARYQIPLDRAWLFRADATYQFLESAEDNFGIRTELRRKF